MLVDVVAGGGNAGTVPDRRGVERAELQCKAFDLLLYCML